MFIYYEVTCAHQRLSITKLSGAGNHYGQARIIEMSCTPATTAPPAAPDAASIVLQRAETFLAPHQSRIDALLSVVAGEHGLAPIHLTGACKTRRMMAAKRQAVALAVEFLCPPLNIETVGAFLNLGRATVYRLEAEVKKLAQSDSVFAARLETLRPRVREALQLMEENGALGETRPTSERQNHHG